MKWHVVLFMLLLLGCAGEVPPAPQCPQRIVSLAPAITEILFAVGAGKRVVGVTSYCNYPEAAKELPKVGDFAVTDFEKIVFLKPDLVIATTDGNPREVIEKIESLGIPTLIVGGKSFSKVMDSVAAVGRAVGEVEKAETLSCEMRQEWISIGNKKARNIPSVLLLYGVDPLVAAGKGSLGDELITQAGGKNVFAGTDKAYVMTDHEKIISLAPEVIVQVAMGSETNEQAREKWSKWSAIPAVKNGRVYVLDPDLLTRPGPRIIDGLRLLEKTLHGDIRDK